MRDAIAWSHDLLTPEEQRLFRCLSIFVGGCTLDAAEAVGGGAPALPSVLDVLSSLVDHSLLRSEEGGDGGIRFGMLETIREFGLERLAGSGEEATIRDAHAAWCLDLAARAVPDWFSPAQKRVGDRIEAEHGNVRAALVWLAETGDVGSGLKLIAAMWPFWFVRGHWAEGREWLDRALAWSAGTRTIERAWALIAATAVTIDRGDDASEARGTEALEIARERGDELAGAHARISLGVLAGARGDAARKTELTEAALAVFRELGDSVPSAVPLASVMLDNLAFVAVDQGDYERAAHLAEEALILQRQIGFSWGMADSFLILARIARGRGDAAHSVARARESLSLAWGQTDVQQIVVALDHLALLAAESGLAEPAARLFASAERRHEPLGIWPGPGKHAERDRALAAVRARLGTDAFAAARAAGRALTLEEAVSEALVFDVSPPEARPASPVPWDGLTPREVEVLGLLAAGQTDREIAVALFLSTRTVNTHVANILAKLDVPTRWSAVAWARDGGLLPKAGEPPRHT